MIGCWCEAALVEKIDRARRTRSRSDFCREAIAEKLRILGFDVSEHETASPDRAGKGGPKRVLYPMVRQGAELNELLPGPSKSAGATPKKKTGSAAKSKAG